MDVWTECYRRDISIHALREEGDPPFFSTFHALLRFQSTPSAMRATGRSRPIRPLIIDFNPRPPRGGRHHAGPVPQHHLPISIHALREEGDAETISA